MLATARSAESEGRLMDVVAGVELGPGGGELVLPRGGHGLGVVGDLGGAEHGFDLGVEGGAPVRRVRECRR